MIRLGRSANRSALLLVALSLAACSRNPAKYLASGDKYFKAGKYSEAVIQYRNAVQLSPRLAQAHYKLALAAVQAKSLQEAYKEFRETVTLDPANRDAQLQFAALSIAAKQYDEAKAAAAPRPDGVIIVYGEFDDRPFPNNRAEPGNSGLRLGQQQPGRGTGPPG